MTTKNVKTLCLSMVAVLLFAACSPKVYVQKDDAVNLGSYRTFSWLKPEAQKGRNDLQERKIRNAITAELEKSGWREDARKPDAILTYDVLVERNTRQVSDPVYTEPFTRTYLNPYTGRYRTLYYPSQFAGYSNSQQHVLEGTLTISLMDANTDKVIWQGWTTDYVNTRHLTDKEIQSSVHNIFRKFDVAKN